MPYLCTMFIRVKTTPNSPKRAVQIVASYRDGKKVRQRIVRHVGTALDDKELVAMRELAEHIKATIEQERQPGLFAPGTLAKMAIKARGKQQQGPIRVDLKKIREESRLITGIHEVYGKVYELFGFDKVIGLPSRRKAAIKHLRETVMGRIANPVSKRATALMLKEHYGVGISEDALYRMMDRVDEQVINEIQQQTYDTVRGLFSEPVRVMFYDCATLYFESFTEDELKSNGYSKDMKFNQVQVLLSLLVTPQGLPVGYDVFEGPTYEGHALCTAVEKLKQNYQLDELIVVADSGILNEDNMIALQSAGHHYIVGGRIKNQTKELTAKILDRTQYTHIGDELSILDTPVKEEGLQDDQPNDKRRMVVSHSQKRARKDQQGRQKAIDKLMDKINKSSNPKDWISNYGHSKYIKIEGQATCCVDTEKMQRDQQWDGLLGVITNIDEESMEPAQIMEQYHSLWQVEQCFRVSKTDLRIRPIYHWTPSRIKAHIAICFMALVCVRYLYHLSKVHKLGFSEQGIRQTLIDVQISILSHTENDHKYGIPSKKTTHAEKIYQLMGLRLSDVPFQIS